MCEVLWQNNDYWSARCPSRLLKWYFNNSTFFFWLKIFRVLVMMIVSDMKSNVVRHFFNGFLTQPASRSKGILLDQSK